MPMKLRILGMEPEGRLIKFVNITGFFHNLRRPISFWDH